MALAGPYALRVAAIVAMVVTVTVGVPPEPTLFWQALFDVGHVLIFAAITMVLLDVIGRRQDTPDFRAAIGWTVAATLALAVGTELVQALEPHRDAAFGDFARDAAGMAFVLVLRRPGSDPHSQTVPRLTAALMAVAVLAPFLTVVGIYVQRNRAFPIVLPLNGSSWERRLLSAHGSTLVPGGCQSPGTPDTESLAQLALRPGRYPGFFLEEPYPDWRTYYRLVFRATVDAHQSVTLTLRINDSRHNNKYTDRFNIALVLTPAIIASRFPSKRSGRLHTVGRWILSASAASACSHSSSIGGVRSA